MKNSAQILNRRDGRLATVEKKERELGIVLPDYLQSDVEALPFSKADVKILHGVGIKQLADFRLIKTAEMMIDTTGSDSVKMRQLLATARDHGAVFRDDYDKKDHLDKVFSKNAGRPVLKAAKRPAIQAVMPTMAPAPVLPGPVAAPKAQRAPKLVVEVPTADMLARRRADIDAVYAHTAMDKPAYLAKPVTALDTDPSVIKSLQRQGIETLDDLSLYNADEIPRGAARASVWKDAMQVELPLQGVLHYDDFGDADKLHAVCVDGLTHWAGVDAAAKAPVAAPVDEERLYRTIGRFVGSAADMFARPVDQLHKMPGFHKMSALCHFAENKMPEAHYTGEIALLSAEDLAARGCDERDIAQMGDELKSLGLFQGMREMALAVMDYEDGKPVEAVDAKGVKHTLQRGPA